MPVIVRIFFKTNFHYFYKKVQLPDTSGRLDAERKLFALASVNIVVVLSL